MQRAPASTLAPPARGTAQSPLPRLTLRIRGTVTGTSREQTIDGNVVRVGAHASNDVVIDEPNVAQFHCSLQKTTDGWRVLDTGSRTGTSVDGVRVRDADLPLPQAELRLGEAVITVFALDPVRASNVPDAQAFGAIVGRSHAMQRLCDLLRRVSPSQADVLVEGEPGTGKELVGSEIVAHSSRAEGPLVVVDCGAIHPMRIEQELFGRARGGGGASEREVAGALELARGGTLFLDEVGELPAPVQRRLADALAAGASRRIGGEVDQPLEQRIIAATSRPLEPAVNAGSFRGDLYYRLSVLTVRLPPLRERLEDLEPLVDAFLGQLGRTEDRALFEPLLPAMRAHAWPGNVRELRAFVERTVELGADAAPPSQPESVDGPASGRVFDPGAPYATAKDRVLADFERRYLVALMHESAGNVSQASRRAQLDRMHLHRLLQKHGIHPRGSGRSG
jgi:DNA-binding NtrC family response regulator